MDKIRQELNDQMATRMMIEVNSLALWLSLYDARRTSAIHSMLIESLAVLKKQCDFLIDKLEYQQQKDNKNDTNNYRPEGGGVR
ncbi:MAG: hypothetical protein RSB32_07915 [Mucinivorans sp.]